MIVSQPVNSPLFALLLRLCASARNAVVAWLSSSRRQAFDSKRPYSTLPALSSGDTTSAVTCLIATNSQRSSSLGSPTRHHVEVYNPTRFMHRSRGYRLLVRLSTKLLLKSNVRHSY
ncbi:hypothetical protein F5Y12DRAFT_305398 [Xylaria sp. FL1777]|nr:hypothetical protein F5Y12DRAFT_305398 [Xylaria sp. FL1777]